MNSLDKQFSELIKLILEKGEIRNDRTGVGTKGIFGHQMRFKMDEGFPLLTNRRIHTRTLIHELLWFLSSYDKKYKKFGNTNIKYLIDNDVTIWTEWAYEEYKKNMIKKWSENDLKDEKTVKPFKCLSIKDFEKKIKKDDEFALKHGDLGPVYGKQWVDWGGHWEDVEKTKTYNKTNAETSIVDHLGWEKIYFKGINQIEDVLEQIKENPDSRRHIVSAWNVAEIENMLLPPCHILYQFYTIEMGIQERIKRFKEWNKTRRYDITGMSDIDCMNHYNFPTRRLSLQMYQRSCDLFLGVPFNIASYSLLLHIFAQQVNMIPDEFIWTGGDVHLYSNSIEASKEIMNREPYKLPKLKLNKKDDIKDYRFEDFEIVDYQYHPNIKVDIAV